MGETNKRKNCYAQINVNEKTENVIRYLAQCEGKTIVQTLNQLFGHVLEEIVTMKNDGNMNIKFNHTDKGLLISFNGNSRLEFGKFSEREFNEMVMKATNP
jgi:hypothetical protein